MLGVHLCFNIQWIEWFIYLKQDGKLFLNIYVLNQMEPHKNLNQTLIYSIIFVLPIELAKFILSEVSWS